MSDLIKEEEAKDLMNKAGISEDVSKDFIEKELKSDDEDPREEVLEEETKEPGQKDPDNWSTEYHDKIDNEMPEDLYEGDEMCPHGKKYDDCPKCENPEFTGKEGAVKDKKRMEEEGLEDEPMEEPEMGDEPEMDMEEPEMGDEMGGGEPDMAELGRAIMDALREVPGVDVKDGGGMEEPEMGDEPEMDMEEPEMDMEEPEGGEDIEDEVIEEEFIDDLTEDIMERLEQDAQ